MVRRGCAVSVAVFGALFALYVAFFSAYFEWPGNLIAAGLGALFAAVGVGGVGHIIWAWRDTRAFARADRGEAPAHGQLVVVAGQIRPLGMSLTSPFGGESCVAYEYEIYSQLPSRRGQTAYTQCDLAGFAMAASAIGTRHGSVRLLGYPILDQFRQERPNAPEARARARQYAASAQFEPMQGLAGLKMFAAFDDALADADGTLRKDFRLKDETIPFDRCALGERIVQVGQQVCALGLYDGDKRALVPRGATLNRLWPGTAGEVRSRIVATARSQARLGLTFFAVSHAMLGAAFYMSETRHAREPEDRQASAIRQALQDRNVPALERAVRRGANPNARDTYGLAPLLDVREPAMAAALIRLGADVDVRDHRDGETLLIRAARYGDVALVRVLLDAGASLHAESMGGATALAEATRSGHDEIATLLRQAAAMTGSVGGPELERPRGKVPPSSR